MRLYFSMFNLRFFPLVVLFFLSSPTRADDIAGGRIYRQMCARCHGAEGEGTKDEYAKALTGNWPLDRLTKYIAKEMPDDKPGTLKPDEAASVAKYVYDAFYSPAAQRSEEHTSELQSRLHLVCR